MAIKNVELNVSIKNLDEFQSLVRDVRKKAAALEESIQRLEDVGLKLEAQFADE